MKRASTQLERLPATVAGRRLMQPVGQPMRFTMPMNLKIARALDPQLRLSLPAVVNAVIE